MQLPKELQQVRGHLAGGVGVASMKCSSRRNCNAARQTTQMMMDRLNEVQLPKELQLRSPCPWPWP